MTEQKTHLTVVIGVVFISFSAIFVRMAEAPSLIIAFYRLLFTVILLMPFFLKSGLREVKKIKNKFLFLAVLSGIFLAFHFYVFIASLEYTSVTSSTVIVTIHPIFVGLGSFFILKEKMPLAFINAVIITFLGSIVISLSDAGQGGSTFLGDILAFLGALLMTCYILTGKIARQKISVTTYTFIVYLSSVITLFFLNLVIKEPLYPYAFKEWVLFFAMALVCTILGHNILNWALKFLNPTFISTAILGEPVFATLWAFLLFGEFPGLCQLLGSGLVIVGLYKLIRAMETTL